MGRFESRNNKVIFDKISLFLTKNFNPKEIYEVILREKK